MISLRSSVAAARGSLFSALGLLAACGPTKSTTDSDSDGSTSMASSSSSGPVTTGAPPTACDGGVTVFAQDHAEPATPSGFEQCEGGLIHRVEAVACAVPAVPSNCPADADPSGACLTNDDCTEKPFGSCHRIENFGGVLETGGTAGESAGQVDTSCLCVYGCETDADCPEGQACRCAAGAVGDVAQCIPADCKQDSDCGDGLCALSPSICGPGGIALGCQTAQDSCDADADCEDGFPCVLEAGTWKCDSSVCGRPFVVDAAPVIAPTAAREDWRALVAAPTAPDALRPRLAAYWTRVALFEHASVASFARFILDLMAVGAPPELLIGAQQALADEVEHARIGFALASLYGGIGVGPGPLAIGGAAATGEREAIVAAVIAEACVAETLSALELVEAAARAEDPALRRVLTRVAADEQRHAELGWRVVQWALQGASAAQKRAAAAAFASAAAQAEDALQDMAEESGEPELRAHGVIDAPLRAAVWRRGLDALVRPGAAALCAA